MPWQHHIHQRNYQNTKVRVFNLDLEIFGDQKIKGFTEKCKLNTGILFGHLKTHYQNISRDYRCGARCGATLELQGIVMRPVGKA